MKKNLSFKEDARPSFQFYPKDWMAEPGLRLCSLAARGLWIEMLCIMFFANPRGLLITNNNKVSVEEIAKLVRSDNKTVTNLLAELERNNIFSRLPDGTIYSRRMYKEYQQIRQIEQVRSEAGKRVWKLAGAKKLITKRITKI